MTPDWSDDALAERMDAEDAARRARLTAPGALAAAAAWYAAQNIAVFPLRVGGKAPLLPRAHEQGHPCKGECGLDGHGLYDASTNPAKVRAWWVRTPQANVGIRTGIAFDCIDVDPPNGWLSLAELRDEGIVPPTIGYVITPRGGAHLYIAPTGDGNTTALRDGIDYRGAGGYVVAPPSRLEDGRMWEWSTPLVLA